MADLSFKTNTRLVSVCWNIQEMWVLVLIFSFTFYITTSFRCRGGVVLMHCLPIRNPWFSFAPGPTQPPSFPFPPPKKKVIWGSPRKTKASRTDAGIPTLNVVVAQDCESTNTSNALRHSYATGYTRDWVPATCKSLRTTAVEDDLVRTLSCQFSFPSFNRRQVFIYTDGACGMVHHKLCSENSGRQETLSCREPNHYIWLPLHVL